MHRVERCLFSGACKQEILPAASRGGIYGGPETNALLHSGLLATWAYKVIVANQFIVPPMVSQVLPPSVEKACSHVKPQRERLQDSTPSPTATQSPQAWGSMSRCNGRQQVHLYRYPAPRIFLFFNAALKLAHHRWLDDTCFQVTYCRPNRCAKDPCWNRRCGPSRRQSPSSS